MSMLPIILCMFQSGLVSSLDQPEIPLSQGVLKGLYTKTVNNREFASFLGIPYAIPVVGKNRFQEATELEHWSGTYNATKPPTPCLQLSHLLYKTSFAVHGSEDCLYLNVHTPKMEIQDKKLDVIVFIHGGAFMFMSSTFFGPKILLEQNVILVTFNYRLGPLGFFSTEDEVVPGNNGLKDQVLALKWVQKNIAAFGGNPESVTLAGLSAGGASVHYHILSSLSKGLFHKAIVMSGTSLNPWTQAENIKEKSEYIGSELGCPTHSSRQMVHCLQERPAEHIVGLSRGFLKWLFNPFSPFAPIVESNCHNAFICEQPIDVIKRGQSNDVPILFSYCANEGLYPASEILQENNLDELKQKWDELIPHILDFNYTVPYEKRTQIGKQIKEEYNINLEDSKGIKNFIKMVGDRLFKNDILKTVKLHATLNKSPVYLQRFSYRGKNSGTSLFIEEDLGVCHGDDLFYILSSDVVNTQETEQDKQVSKQMVDIWVSFAANGRLPEPWTPVKNPLLSIVDIKGATNLVQTNDDYSEMSFWDSLNLNENMEHRSCPTQECNL